MGLQLGEMALSFEKPTILTYWDATRKGYVEIPGTMAMAVSMEPSFRVRTTSTFHNVEGAEASALEYQLLHNAICEVHKRGLTHLANHLATYMTEGKDMPPTQGPGAGSGSTSTSSWEPSREPRRVATSSVSSFTLEEAPSIGCLLDLQGHHVTQPVQVPVEAQLSMAPSVNMSTVLPTIPLPNLTETEKINMERKKERIKCIEKKLSDEITNTVASMKVGCEFSSKINLLLPCLLPNGCPRGIPVIK